MKIAKSIIAGVFVLTPAVVSADAIAVAMGAQFQHTAYTLTFDATHSGSVEIPAQSVSGNIYSPGYIFNPVVTGTFSGTTQGATATYGGESHVEYTVVRPELTSISIAAAAGRSAVASAATNARGSTTANAGASEARGAVLNASSESDRRGSYSSEVNVRENRRR